MPRTREIALAAYFTRVDDPRIKRTTAHILLDIIIITIWAVVCVPMIGSGARSSAPASTHG
jgi:hypothetical protein